MYSCLYQYVNDGLRASHQYRIIRMMCKPFLAENGISINDNACSSAGKHVSRGLVVVILFYTEVILCMLQLAVEEFHDSVIKLSCLSDISDFPTLDQIYLRNVARCVSQMFLLILCL